MRRNSTWRSAGADGDCLNASKRANTKSSIGLRDQSPLRTWGIGDRCSGRNDQCSPQTAPWSIQRASVSRSRWVSCCFASVGGMRSCGSLWWIRCISRLFAEFPGMMTGFSVRNAPARVSNRSSPWRAAPSGPWQGKQARDKIGRTSALKSTATAVRVRSPTARLMMTSRIYVVWFISGSQMT